MPFCLKAFLIAKIDFFIEFYDNRLIFHRIEADVDIKRVSHC
jgi:hypothetical protein